MLKITAILAMIAIITSAIRLDTNAKVSSDEVEASTSDQTKFCDKKEISKGLTNSDCFENDVRDLRVEKTSKLASWKTYDDDVET